MIPYTVHFRDGSTATITADHFEADGSGTRFFDAEGGLVASFYDGEARRVLPASAPVEAPAGEGE